MKWIRACLDSLENQTYSDYTVYVIDNNSSDETCDVIQSEYAWVTLLENDENLGFAKGNNVAIKQALKDGCTHVVLLNQDTVVEENFIEAGIESLTDKNVGFTSPKLLYKSNKTIWWAGSKIFRKSELMMRPFFQIATHVSKKAPDSEAFTGAFETDYIPGTSLFTRKDVLKKVGLLDESFFMYSEDVDWSLRAKKAGFKLHYFSDTVVLHDTPFGKEGGRPSLARIWFKFKNYFGGVKRVVDKHFTLTEKIIWYIKLPITLPLTLLYELF